MRLRKKIGLGVVALLVAFFAAAGLFAFTRSTPLEYVSSVGDHAGAPHVADSSFAGMMSLFTGTELLPGTRVEIMTSGDQTYPRLWADLRGARQSITLQLYYCNEGAAADTFKNIITERARAGVKVFFLRDAFGASGLSKAYLASLRAAGVRVAPFRPMSWHNLHKEESRAHIRVVVVDGQIGYTGGFGLDDKWLGDGRHKGQWRDTNVRFTGPAVHELQATFAKNWVEATGELLTGQLLFPPITPAKDGASLAGLLHAAPTIGSTAAERFFALSIAGAQRRLYLTAAYFVPDDHFLRLLVESARRGVDTRVLTAGPNGTDVKTTYYAARARYEKLLRGGVRIYEYQPAMMHAKTLVADGTWANVGTINFDNRSIALNDESALLWSDPRLGAAMDSIFLTDLRYSHEVTLGEFERRGLWQRIMERGASLISRVL